MKLRVPGCGTFEAIPFLVLITFGPLNILSLLLVISTPIIHTIDLVHINVTVNELNGFLTLGTLGYCLNVSDQNVCSPRRSLRPAYAINNTQVLAQLTVGANIVISAISIANLVALISGAIFTSIFAYDTRCAMYPLADDVSLDCGLSCAFFSALVSFMSVSVAWVSEYVLIKNQVRKSAGVGYWINAAIFGLFAIFVFTVLPSKLFRLLHLRRLWQQREALRQEAPRQEVQRQEAQRQEVQRQEVQRQEARRQEARKQEARRQRKLMKENLRQKASKHDKLIIDTRRQRPQVNHLQPTWQNRETGKWKDYPPPIEYRR